jgi:hypothetical protein
MIHFSLETLLSPAVMVVSIQLAFIFAELYQLKTKLKSKTAKVDVASLPSDLPSIRLEEVVSVAATPVFSWSISLIWICPCLRCSPLL